MLIHKQNCIFYTFFMIVLLGVAAISIKVIKQETSFLQDQMLYDQAVLYFEEDNNNAAELLLDELKVNYPDNEFIHYLDGVNAASSGQSARAVEAFQKALDANPHLIETSTFLIAFTDVLVQEDYLLDAKLMLSYCQALLEQGFIEEGFLIERIEELEAILYET